MGSFGIGHDSEEFGGLTRIVVDQLFLAQACSGQVAGHLLAVPDWQLMGVVSLELTRFVLFQF